MKPSFTLLAYLFASVLIVSFFAKSLDVVVDRANSGQIARENIKRTAYTDTKGELKYAEGSCKDSADCTPTGCGGEFCASKKLVSSCEVKPDAPNDDYSCTCFNSKCAWVTK